jgi:hypothetical protein
MFCATVTKVTPSGFVAVTALVNMNSLVITEYVASWGIVEKDTKLPGLNVGVKFPLT